MLRFYNCHNLCCKKNKGVAVTLILLPTYTVGQMLYFYVYIATLSRDSSWWLWWDYDVSLIFNWYFIREHHIFDQFIWSWDTSLCSATHTPDPDSHAVAARLSWWRHQMETFPRYWPFVRGIHWSPVNSPHKGQWRGALMFSLICAWMNAWVNNSEAGDLRRPSVHFDVIVMIWEIVSGYISSS